MPTTTYLPRQDDAPWWTRACPMLPPRTLKNRRAFVRTVLEPPVKFRPHSNWSIFFVVVSYTSNLWNCKLLWNTLISVEQLHTGSPVVVVDNGSPVRNLLAALPPTVPIAQLVSCSPGKGMLGALEYAATVLSKPKFASQWQRVVLLQHSTWLRRPLPVVTGCPVLSIQGSFSDSFDRSCGLRDLRHVECEVAREALNADIGDPCSAPTSSVAGQAQKGAWGGTGPLFANNGSRGVLRWAAAFHGTLQFTRIGWRAFVQLGIIEVPGNASTPISSVRKMWAAVLKGESTMRVRNQGWERLAGMVVAGLQILPGETVAGPRALLTCSLAHNSHVLKRHGGSFSRAYQQVCANGPAGPNFLKATNPHAPSK